MTTYKNNPFSSRLVDTPPPKSHQYPCTTARVPVHHRPKSVHHRKISVHHLPKSVHHQNIFMHHRARIRAPSKNVLAPSARIRAPSKNVHAPSGQNPCTIEIVRAPSARIRAPSKKKFRSSRSPILRRSACSKSLLHLFFLS